MTDKRASVYCQYDGCQTPLRGNPNDKQCEHCLRVFCPKHLTKRDRYGDRWCVDHHYR